MSEVESRMDEVEARMGEVVEWARRQRLDIDSLIAKMKPSKDITKTVAGVLYMHRERGISLQTEPAADGLFKLTVSLMVGGTCYYATISDLHWWATQMSEEERAACLYARIETIIHVREGT